MNQFVIDYIGSYYTTFIPFRLVTLAAVSVWNLLLLPRFFTTASYNIRTFSRLHLRLVS